ncbi:DTW domain-containing protein [Pseudoalteromonas tunicata]|uniref:tRNA-uridine aminocarboxypropyltransferase n=1 Tax=Pseudoalteromonas tunicata TaxID=314281 RepID=UPI00273E2D45|nr:tRNA-uridine aminocarboxypropyltransferase [Pseudoalteromonas tunicata]MDP5211576.1 DTW domain-containing protein [Pseudoalteromonas tunicata]
MSRLLCTVCCYPQLQCVCKWASPIDNKTSVFVMQHPSEVKAAKNTVRLTSLCLKNIRVFIGEQPNDYMPLQQLDVESTFVVYPDQSDLFIESLPRTQLTKDKINLIFIDGTWKKTYKLLKLNPWLTRYKFISFAHMPKGQYHIRKAPRLDSLSTLEAIAYSLTQLEQLDVCPLYHLLDAMMEQQFSAMPTSVKQRYLDT